MIGFETLWSVSVNQNLPIGTSDQVAADYRHWLIIASLIPRHNGIVFPGNKKSRRF